MLYCTWLSSPNISLAVGKEKASAIDGICSRKAKVKHKFAFSMLKFTVFFFGISRKGFKKAGKALKSALLSKKRFFALISAIMPSKRGHDCLASAIFSHQKLKMRESSFSLILRSVICKLPPGEPFLRHHALQHSSPAPNGVGLRLSGTL